MRHNCHVRVSEAFPNKTRHKSATRIAASAPRHSAPAAGLPLHVVSLCCALPQGRLGSEGKWLFMHCSFTGKRVASSIGTGETVHLAVLCNLSRADLVLTVQDLTGDELELLEEGNIRKLQPSSLRQGSASSGAGAASSAHSSRRSGGAAAGGNAEGSGAVSHYIKWIRHDLEQWSSSGITRELVDEAQARVVQCNSWDLLPSWIRFQIVGGRCGGSAGCTLPG
jgi:hypothetical protein